MHLYHRKKNNRLARIMVEDYYYHNPHKFIYEMFWFGKKKFLQRIQSSSLLKSLHKNFMALYSKGSKPLTKTCTFAAYVTCFILMGCINFEPIEPCYQVDCSGHGQCQVAADGLRATCQCDDGYISDGLSCHEEQGLGGEVLLCRAMAALLREGEVACAGVLIAPDWVLTTANCATQTESVAFPSTKVLTISVVPTLTVDQVIQSEDHRLALLHLESPSRNVPAVLGTDQNGASLEGHSLIMTGWGEEDGTLSGRPSIGSTVALQDDISRCPSVAAPNGGEVCLRLTADHNGIPCYGQQGSPLWIDDYSTTQLVALASVGTCPAENDNRSQSFILITPYLEWLRENVTTDLEPARDDIDGSEQCGTVSVDETAWNLVDNKLDEAMEVCDSSNSKKHIVIPVYFNVFHSDLRGDISNTQIDIQMTVLNDAFSEKWGGYDTKIHFVNAGFPHYKDEGLFHISYESDAHPPSENESRANFRQGGLNALNIYTADVLGDSSPYLLGWATYPWNVQDSLLLDGVVVDYRSLPQGTIVGYDQGLTVVHQVGHWLGLMHPHSDDCSDTDFIFDTPTQNGPTLGCPLWRDTCEEEGPDAIHNYMSFSHDHCRVEFTAEQADRIRSHYSFRCGSGGAIEWNIDRMGNDYRDFEADSDGAEECRRACLAEERCKAFAYGPKNSNGTDTIWSCWLKDAIPLRAIRKDVASGVVRGGEEYDVDRMSKNYDKLTGADITREGCRDTCITEPQCVAYTYVPPTAEAENAECWLKDAIPKPRLRSGSGMVSGLIREDGFELNVTRNGTPLDSFEIAPPDVHACQRACAEEDGCQGFVHTMEQSNSSADCVLMAEIGAPRAAPRAISGIVRYRSPQE